jgi:hypothetical protein
MMTIDTTNMCSHLQKKLFDEDGIYHPLWLAMQDDPELTAVVRSRQLHIYRNGKKVLVLVWQQLEERIVEVFFSDQEIDDMRYQIATIPFVAHNARFDEGCLKAVFKVYQMDYLRRAAYCPGVFHRRTDFDDNNHRHPLRFAEHETRYAGHLAVRHEGEVEAITTRLSEHIHECAMVLRGRHLDLAHPYLLWPHFLRHHHWYPLRKDALPFGKAGLVTFWKRARIVYE